jgi:3-oxoacyl-[acyl-carrier-protein] synthase-3
MAGISEQDIDQIIVATATSDRIFPSCACFIQNQLGIKNRPAFDIGAACAGFNYALGIADQFIRNGSSRCILVVGSETLSRILDWNDRATCVLLADGAGAVILCASEEPGIHSTHLAADGQYQDLLYALSSVSPTGKIEPPHMKMQGNEVFKVAVKTLGDLVVTTLLANGLQPRDLDWLIPHQANLRIITAMAKKLELPMEQVIVTIQKHGNTSAASIPLALDEAVRDGRIKRGQKLLLESFGGGFTWGSALITY